MVSMAERITPLPLTSSRADQIFPTMTSLQIERVATHGRRRAVRSGEALVEQGDRAIPFFVVISGELEAVRPTCATETLITIVRPGQFTGEINTLTGRRALARIRARQDGEVIQLSRENVLTVVQTDAELSEILMRAFILRRVELLAQGIGAATLVGSSHCPDTLPAPSSRCQPGSPALRGRSRVPLPAPFPFTACGASMTRSAFFRTNVQCRLKTLARRVHWPVNRPIGAHSDCVWKSVLSGFQVPILPTFAEADAMLCNWSCCLSFATSTHHGFQLFRGALRTRLGYSQGSWFQHSPICTSVTTGVALSEDKKSG